MVGVAKLATLFFSIRPSLAPCLFMYMYIVRSRGHEIVVTALRDHDEMNQLLVDKWKRMNTFSGERSMIQLS